jgi:hypothetical protein
LRRRPTAAPSDHHAAGAASATVAEVARLVRLTATHDPRPGDDAGALLCDADVAILAADPAGYDAYAAAVRREYAHLPDEVFRAGRAAVLRSLLGRPALYRVVGERADWEPRARATLTRGAIEAVLSTLAGARPGRRCEVMVAERLQGGERERLTERQESVSLPPLRSEVTWGNSVEHSGSRGFADTEGVTGSNPVAPTNTTLTSRDAGQVRVRTGSAVREPAE